MNYFSSIVIALSGDKTYDRITVERCFKSIVRDNDRTPHELVIVLPEESAAHADIEKYILEFQHTIETSHVADIIDPITHRAKTRAMARSKDKVIIKRGSAGSLLEAYLTGLKAASGEMIACIDAHLVLTEGWFRSLLWAADYHRWQVVSPTIRSMPPDLLDLEERTKALVEKNLLKSEKKQLDLRALVMSHKTADRILEANSTPANPTPQARNEREQTLWIQNQLLNLEKHFGIVGASIVYE